MRETNNIIKIFIYLPLYPLLYHGLCLDNSNIPSIVVVNNRLEEWSLFSPSRFSVVRLWGNLAWFSYFEYRWYMDSRFLSFQNTCDVWAYSITPIEYVSYCMDTMTLLPLLPILPKPIDHTTIWVQLNTLYLHSYMTKHIFGTIIAVHNNDGLLI